MERRPPAFLGGRKLESSCQHFHALSCENPGQQSNSLPFYQSPFVTDPNIHVTDTVVLAEPAQCHSCFWWTPQLKAQECHQPPRRSSKALDSTGLMPPWNFCSRSGIREHMLNPNSADSRNVSRMFCLLGDQKTPPVDRVQQAHTQWLSLEFYMINKGNVFLVRWKRS